MHIRSVNLELKQLAFSLIEPSPEVADFLDGNHKPGKAEDRAIVMLRIIAADVGANVAKLVQIGNVGQSTSQKHEDPRLRTGLGMRATRVCASVG